MDQTLHRVATKEREEIKRTTKQKMARQHNKAGRNHLDQESDRQKAMEDTDGGIHPAGAVQSLDERRKTKSIMYSVCFPTSCLTTSPVHCIKVCVLRLLKV